MINVKNISFNYGSKQALDNVSFSVTSGFNVLLGANGAGKSTLISLLTGLYRPCSGEIFINNCALATSKKQAMKTFGVVFQQPTLDLDLTVKQNLIYHGALHGLNAKQSLLNIEQMLIDLEIVNRLDHKVRSLNGGHRRRVEIVRALIHQPKVLLLDEASVGLDSASRILIISHIRKMSQQRDICVLWATHLFDEISLTDHVVILEHGKLQRVNKVTELCQQYQLDDLSLLFGNLTNQGLKNAN